VMRAHKKTPGKLSTSFRHDPSSLRALVSR